MHAFKIFASIFAITTLGSATLTLGGGNCKRTLGDLDCLMCKLKLKNCDEGPKPPAIPNPDQPCKRNADCSDECGGSPGKCYVLRGGSGSGVCNCGGAPAPAPVPAPAPKPAPVPAPQPGPDCGYDCGNDHGDGY
ncbi:hypothetical protein BS50DRAFT_569429 [Corynespora cassiicola Philippines]|uniref:Uncharacterized protein n=1 Tax=Corynespora cassiicola Philippines TaxID=1448308 RepID=A0A2T2P3A5_CORCC|nr:hypothetical protein BS50DRAFT_569429 [Corynespora cassiicola Philippines]